MTSNLAFCVAACGSIAGLYDTYGVAAAVVATIVWATIAVAIWRKTKAKAV